VVVAVAPAVTTDEASSLSRMNVNTTPPIPRCATVPLRGVSYRACCDHGRSIFSVACECERNNPNSLDARLFLSVVLAVAPAVTTDEASSLSRVNVNNHSDSLDARLFPSVVLAVAPAVTTDEASSLSRVNVNATTPIP